MRKRQNAAPLTGSYCVRHAGGPYFLPPVSRVDLSPQLDLISVFFGALFLGNPWLLAAPSVPFFPQQTKTMSVVL